MYYLLFFLLPFITFSLNAYQAVVKVPVVDCFCFSMANDFTGPTITTDTDRSKNPRECQLLFNELVEVLESTDNYLLVELPNSLCYNRKHDRIECIVWVHKNTLLPISVLDQQGISLNSIPPAIHFTFKSLAQCSAHLVTLIRPFDDPVTQQRYSAGTRFVRKSELDTQEYYAVMIIDHAAIELKTTYIPITSGHIYEEKSHEELIDDFITLIRCWSHQEPLWIPYVWGGGSFMYAVDENSIHPYAVYCGYDCSSLILRAAQICGIPYCLRDSTTINKVFKPLDGTGSPHNGDIIWLPGHVMIITSVEHNLLAQARGYGSGYGKTYESELCAMFEGIIAYADLMEAYRTKQPLRLLNHQGQAYREVSKFKIFPLAQIWQKD